MNYGEYISNYAGSEFELGIQKILDYNTEQFGWTELDSERIQLASSLNALEGQTFIKDIAYRNGQNKKYFVISHSTNAMGFKSVIHRSTDGVSWASKVYEGYDFKDIYFDGTRIFLSVEDEDGKTFIWVTSDLVEYTNIISNSVNSIISSIISGNGTSIAIGYSFIYVSINNGETWAEVNGPFEHIECLKIAFYNNTFYVLEVDVSQNYANDPNAIYDASVFRIYTTTTGLEWDLLYDIDSFSIDGSSNYYYGNTDHLYYNVSHNKITITGGILVSNSTHPGYLEISLSDNSKKIEYIKNIVDTGSTLPLLNDIAFGTSENIFNVSWFNTLQQKVLITNAYRQLPDTPNNSFLYEFVDLDSTDKIISIDYDTEGYILLSNSKVYFDDLFERLIDLNSLTTIQNVVIDGYKNGPFLNMCVHPINVSIVEITATDSTTHISQMLRYNKEIYIRDYDSTTATYGDYRLLSSDPFVYVGEVYPLPLTDNSLFIRLNAYGSIVGFYNYKVV